MRICSDLNDSFQLLSKLLTLCVCVCVWEGCRCRQGAVCMSICMGLNVYVMYVIDPMDENYCNKLLVSCVFWGMRVFERDIDENLRPPSCLP